MLKNVLPLLTIVLIASLLAGCGGSTEQGMSIDMVPQRADVVAQIIISDILEDDDLISLYDRLPKDPGNPQTFEDVKATVIEETGINLENVEHALLFGDSSSGTGDDGYFGVIVTGAVEETSLVTAIEEAADIELNPSDYKGYGIYTDPDQLMAMAFIDEETFVIGSVESVKDVIDIETGDASALTGEVADKYDILSNVLARLSASVDPELTENAIGEVSESLPIALDLSAFADIELAGLTVDRDEQSITLDLELCFTGSGSAKDFKGLISIAKALVNTPEILNEYLGESPSLEAGLGLLTGLFANLEVSTVDSCVTIDITMTLDEIEELLTAE